jgi:hypothetical protein
MQRNTYTRPISTNEIANCPHFKRGVMDARSGKPFDYAYCDGLLSKRLACRYERGRYIGLVYAGRLTYRSKVTAEAKEAILSGPGNLWPLSVTRADKIAADRLSLAMIA